MSPLLYSIYTHDCTPASPSNIIIKFADDTTVVGLIQGGDESAYRNDVQKLSLWCTVNNLSLNTDKTKKLIMDFRRHGAEPAPLHINRVRVSTLKFLGVQISEDLTWSANTTGLVNRFLQLYHGECIGAMRRAMVLWLFGSRKKSSAEGD